MKRGEVPNAGPGYRRHPFPGKVRGALARDSWPPGDVDQHRSGSIESSSGGIESIFCNRKDHDALRAALSGREFDAVVDIVHARTLPPDIAAVLDAVGPSLQRYVYCSSSTVYDKNGVYPITELHPRKRREKASPYLQAKLQNEDFLFERSQRGTED